MTTSEVANRLSRSLDYITSHIPSALSGTSTKTNTNSSITSKSGERGDRLYTKVGVGDRRVMYAPEVPLFFVVQFAQSLFPVIALAKSGGGKGENLLTDEYQEISNEYRESWC